ncbi:hypothetical protein MK805_09120 [Shimazuella sp. AN120528]|uniref:hypothetical protein n=1 Tax=Shimazuella soli TaxID=1892854 RepID=UPI001F0F1E06|nr:hypothetical protein [Shimazuella soli]MCH5585129.1 hypothetical protein [Shimazuella soli]
MDRGKKLADRLFCPKEQGNACSCDVCDTYYGFGGLGKSENKFNFSNDFGGQLEQKVGSEVFRFLMRKVNETLCRFGGDKVTSYTTYDPQLSQRAEEAGLNSSFYYPKWDSSRF